jgi:dipeptidase E
MYIMGLSKGVGAVGLAIGEGLLPHRTLGFVPTAGETYANPYFVDESRRRIHIAGVKTVDLDVTRSSEEVLSEQLDSVDGIFVAGGNSFFLLQQLRAKDLLDKIVEKVRNGFPYFGESAGAVLLINSIEPAKPIDDPQDVPGLTDYTAMGLVDFFVLPHADREKYKPLFDDFRRENRGKLRIVEIRDDQAVLTRDGTSYEIIDSPIASLD